MPKTPQWVTTWPDWLGQEFSNQNVTVVPKSNYDTLERELADRKAELAETKEMLRYAQQEMVIRGERAIEAESRLASHAEREPLANSSDEERVRDLAQRMINRWNGPSEMLLGFLRLLIRPAPSAASGLAEWEHQLQIVRAVLVERGEDKLLTARLDSVLCDMLRSHQAPVGEGRDSVSAFMDPDERGCRRFIEAMLDKLAIKRAEGKYGWDDPSVCSIEELQNWMREHIEKGDPVDIANYCMMIWNRSNPLSPQTGGGS